MSESEFVRDLVQEGIRQSTQLDYRHACRLGADPLACVVNRAARGCHIQIAHQ
jgi:hypothetical protein